MKMHSLALVLVLVVCIACTVAPVPLPPRATVIYHGPFRNLTNAIPPGSGTVMAVDAKTGGLVGVVYVSPEEVAAGGPTRSIEGLKRNKVYAVYFVPDA